MEIQIVFPLRSSPSRNWIVFKFLVPPPYVKRRTVSEKTSRISGKDASGVFLCNYLWRRQHGFGFKKVVLRPLNLLAPKPHD